MPANRQKSLFIFENIKRERLYVSKNSNFQTLVKKDWWPDVHHINVQHFDSLDELEDALARFRNGKTKWNCIGAADAMAAHSVQVSKPAEDYDIFKDGFPVDD